MLSGRLDVGREFRETSSFHLILEESRSCQAQFSWFTDFVFTVRKCERGMVGRSHSTSGMVDENDEHDMNINMGLYTRNIY